VRLLKRILQRLLILGLGILSVWLIVFVVFEDADRRLPWYLALGLTYGIAAYIVLPRALRMGLKILQRKSVPSFTTAGDGYQAIPSTLRSQGRSNSFVPPLQLLAGQRPIGWVWQVRGG
jgi:hypothetical protein